jgi:YD repeat-containing protein
VLTFSSSGYETQRLVYQGAQSGGNVIENQQICYNNNTTSCPTATVTAPITQRSVSQNLSGTGGKVSKRSTNYNTVGLPTEIDDYDWGAATPTRKTTISYASLTNGILDRPAQISVGPGSSNFDTVETDYNSDGELYRVTQPYQASAGATNSSAPATTYTNYDGLGRVGTVTDGGGGVTSFTYSQNITTRSITPAPTWDNETAKTWAFQTDGLGRLANVCEVAEQIHRGVPAGSTIRRGCGRSIHTILSTI